MQYNLNEAAGKRKELLADVTIKGGEGGIRPQNSSARLKRHTKSAEHRNLFTAGSEAGKRMVAGISRSKSTEELAD